MLAALVALGGDHGRAREHVARPHLLGEPHLQPAHRLGPEPVLHHPGRESHREHPVAEHRGVPDLGGDRVVVVHRVEVAAGAGVPHEHRARQRRELLLAFLADGNGVVVVTLTWPSEADVGVGS